MVFFPQWKDAKPDELMDSKLRCVFEMPSENDKVVSGLLAESRYWFAPSLQALSSFFFFFNSLLLPPSSSSCSCFLYSLGCCRACSRSCRCCRCCYSSAAIDLAVYLPGLLFYNATRSVPHRKASHPVRLVFSLPPALSLCLCPHPYLVLFLSIQVFSWL